MAVRRIVRGTGGSGGAATGQVAQCTSNCGVAADRCGVGAHHIGVGYRCVRRCGAIARDYCRGILIIEVSHAKQKQTIQSLRTNAVSGKQPILSIRGII